MELKLERFDKNKKKKRIVIVASIGIFLVVSVITLYKTFAFYEEEKSFNILKGRVPEFSKSDITLAFTIDGKTTTDKFPNKGDGYIASNVTCEDEVTAKWDNKNWGLVDIVNTNNKKIKCSINFETVNFAKLITNCNKDATSCLLENGIYAPEELAFDETIDNNLRYIGTNPNNYVKFNNELWRIMGVMNNIEDNDEKKFLRIKLIKAEVLETKMLWDTAETNNWENSSLKRYLNEEYYDSLTDDAKSMISSITWNLGGASTSNATANIFYTEERGEIIYQNSRPIEGIGYIGIMYSSDYGFAVGGSARSTCLSINLKNYNTNNCYTNNWLYNSSAIQATLTANSSDNYTIYNVSTTGGIGSVMGIKYSISPVVYLNSNIKITSGSGTAIDPFILGI